MSWPADQEVLQLEHVRDLVSALLEGCSWSGMHQNAVQLAPIVDMTGGPQCWRIVPEALRPAQLGRRCTSRAD
jgi:hypothetical protein